MNRLGIRLLFALLSVTLYTGEVCAQNATAGASIMPADQQIADFIKDRLQAEQQQGNLQGFDVDMRVEEGTVWFKGQVSNTQHEMTILKTAQAAAHLGVLKVVDDIKIAAAQTPVQQSVVDAKPPARAPQANYACLLYTSPSPRDLSTSRMPSSA